MSCNILTTTDNKEIGEISYDNVQKSINGFNKHIGLITKEKVSEKELSDLLSKFDTKEIERKNFPILISADENVRNGKIVELFDIIRMSGFASVSLRTSGKK